MNRIEMVFQFIVELDKLKSVCRQNRPVGLSRRENSAEHSWQVALLAMTLESYSAQPINILRVIQMLLLHDVVEIDAGDTILYDEAARKAKEVEEHRAAQRIFALLPSPLNSHYLDLWEEFEERKSPEAIFAYSMDRLMPVIQNFYNRPTTWEEHQITLDQVVKLNTPIGHGAPEIWHTVEQKIRDLFSKSSVV